MIKELLAGNSLFSHLPDSFFSRIEDRLEHLSFKIGQTVLKSGDHGDGLYIIYSGKARVVDDTHEGKPVTLTTLTKGDHFGERSLLYGEPAASTVRAAGNLVVLKLPEDDFQQLVEDVPGFRERLEEHIHRYNEYNFLKTLQLISDLKPQEIESLVDSMETVELSSGEYLFHEGDSGDAAYIIRKGRVRVIKESAGNILLSILKPGDLIGEMSLLHSEPRSAGIVATEEVSMLRLSQEVFNKILHDSESMAELLPRQVSNRLLQQKASMLAEEKDEEEADDSLPQVSVTMQAVRKGAWSRRYPYAVAETAMLSGIACLAMINRYFRQDRDLEAIIERQVFGGLADTLMTLNRKLEDQGYVTRLLTLNEETLGSATLPAIVESADGQLSVVYSVSSDYVDVANPLTGVQRVSREEFVHTWDRRLLAVSYVPDFAATGQVDVGLLKRFLPMLKPYWKLIAGIGAVSVVIQLFGLAAPLFSKVIIDNVLVHGDYSLLYLMLLGMLFVTGFQLISGTLREFLIAHAMRRISVTLLLRFFQHVLSLPQRLFSKFDAGDYTQRFQENENFLQLVSESGFKIIVDSITIVIYLVVLLTMNAKLTGVSMIFVPPPAT